MVGKAKIFMRTVTVKDQLLVYSNSKMALVLEASQQLSGNVQKVQKIAQIATHFSLI